jgi:hypothetical protein
MTEVQALEYIRADIYTPLRKDWPCGKRGWFIVSEGDKWVKLFSPATLEVFKLKVSEFDEMPYEHQEFNRERMIERIEANREVLRKYGHRDGGRTTDRVLAALKGEPLFLQESDEEGDE